MYFRKALEEIKPYVPGKSIEEIQREFKINNIVKLASNENPYDCSKAVIQCLSDVKSIASYPDNNCSKLRKVLSEKYNIKEAQLIVGGGSVEIISMIGQIFVDPDDEVITCTPSFSSYYSSTKLMDGKLIEVPLKDDAFDLEGIISKITDRTKLIYISNPNNPTGTIITADEQSDFLKKVPKNIAVILDEAYYEFVTDKLYPNSINFLNEFDNIIILRTFSKAYGLAGLRVGYGIASEEIVEQLNKVRNPFNVSILAQDAACTALLDMEFLKMVINNNAQVLNYMYGQLDKLGISYIVSQANFIMINCRRNGRLVSHELLEKGFIVRPGFPLMDDYIRVSIGTMEQMKEFIVVLDRMINGGIK
ncbi:MAG TPA: histidinol-phosphate transaminase [Clostridiales bacterium]|nr:MAG: histidinol-phosphate transaminase [Clostridiales bacterium GWD2_32_19]HCC07874.1 histidinol-phosphate transaminase [Clostridiales bacterium]